jgi:hypothetical protein
MSELSFLIELLLNHDLQKVTKDLVASRIKEVEAAITSKPQPFYPTTFTAATIPMPQQAPSTLALMAKHGDLPPVPTPVMPPIEPVAQIAQTAATAAAMNSRHAAIAASIAGATDKTTGRPRKF